MVDKKTAAGDSSENVWGMSADEQKFLLECLMLNTGGTIQVDHVAVAEHRGLANSRSVINRLSLLRKRYNIPMTGSSAIRKTGEKADSGGFAPTTPKKTTKSSTKTPAKAKGPVKKSKVAVASQDDDEDVESGANIEKCSDEDDDE